MAALQPTPTVVVCLLSVLHHTPFFGVQQGRWGAIHVLECRKVGGPSASSQRTERECIYIHLHRRLLERSEFRAVWNQDADPIQTSVEIDAHAVLIKLPRVNTVEIAVTPLVEGTSGSLSPCGRGLG